MLRLESTHTQALPDPTLHFYTRCGAKSLTRQDNVKSIIIVGGGIIGLATAWQLAKRGFSVRLFDRGQAGRQASWAAAGMLSQQIELRPGYETLMPLLRQSAAMWPGFAAQLEAESGRPVNYRTCGTLVPALNDDELRQLRHNYRYLQSLTPKLAIEWVDGEAMRSLCPLLARTVRGGLVSTHDHQVDNRLVVQALVVVLRKVDVELFEHTAVSELLLDGDCCRGIVAGGRRVLADHTIVAAGAWSRQLGGLPPESLPPVRPVKGQVLALEIPSVCQPLTHVITSTKTYLAPKGNRLIVGATVEEEGFDTSITSGGLMDLLFGAYQLMPGTREWRVAETWAGLRPGTYDNEPIFGASGIAGLTYATGHYRNGILLAPITACKVAEYVATGTLPTELANYTLARFSPPSPQPPQLTDAATSGAGKPGTLAKSIEGATQ